MTVSQLIDYLSQHVQDGDGDLPVVLHDGDYEGDGDYLSLSFVFIEAQLDES